MANVLVAGINLAGQISVSNSDVPVSPVSSIQTLGTNVTTPGTTFNSATTATPTAAYATSQTLASAANFDIDLNGGTLYDTLNVAIVWTKLMYLLVNIVSADGTLKVKVGPQNVTNGLDIGMGGTGASNYVEIRNHLEIINQSAAGFTVDATHKIIRINNSGASSATVQILAIGKP